MENYVDLNYSDPNYTEGDIIVTDCEFIESLNSTLNLLFQKVQAIETKLSTIDTQILNGIDASTLDLTPIASTIETVVTAAVTDNISGLIANASLNGYGAEYKDGDSVTVSGRDIIYTVNRSFFSMYADNAYTVHYDLTSSNGQKMIVPEALLTRYIPTAP